LLSDYKTAIVSTNVADTRHVQKQYVSLPVTDTLVARNTCWGYCKWTSVFSVFHSASL